ncbi:MAG: hypothetical protein DME19_13490 [Verrucomicrobia bacterium]|nr:MAG: hypothetical protein DME19_13490 [Verrucomicrobiota bacterium]
MTNVLLQFQQSGLVQYAEPDYILHALNTVPNDPLFSIPDNDPNTVDQWGMNNLGQDNGTAGADINAPEAWDIQ